MGLEKREGGGTIRKGRKNTDRVEGLGEKRIPCSTSMDEGSTTEVRSDARVRIPDTLTTVNYSLTNYVEFKFIILLHEIFTGSSNERTK